MNFKICFFAVFSILIFNSCLGMSADIVMQADGSGRITLEYRVSQLLESIGRLDGNEHLPVIPAGRRDFERAVARIPGLRLVSHSSKNSGGMDLVNTAVLEFQNPAALLAFLDSTGTGASYSRETSRAQANTLRLTLRDAAGVADTDLLSLLREISEGYKISVSLTSPNDASLAVIPASPANAQTVFRGRKVSFSIDTGDLLSIEEGLALEITW